MMFLSKKSFVPSVPDDPKQALYEYFHYLEREYSWYERAAVLHNVVWFVAQGTVIIVSLLTALIAALAHDETFKDYGLLRACLIGLPLLGTLASSVLLQTRVRDLLNLRDRGRQDVRTIIDQGRAEFAAATSPERYTEIHRELITKMDKLDKEQTVGFFAVVPEVKAGPA